MELDELKTLWTAQNHKLDAVIRLNRQLLDAPIKDQARSALNRLAGWTVVNAIGVWAGVPLMGIFIAHPHTSLKFVVPALFLDAYSVASMIMLIRQVVAIRRLDYSQPVTSIQKQLEALRIMRIRSSRWIWMTMPLMWPPVIIVAAKGLLGLDLYVLSPGWLIVNGVLGLAMIPLIWWMAHRVERSNSPTMQRLLHHIGGRNLNAATAFLASIADFEEERPA